MRSTAIGTRPSGKFSLSFLLPAAAFSVVLALSGGTARAEVNEFDYDCDLAKALTELQEPRLRDYARFQLDFMLDRYKRPEQLELIFLEQARLYFMAGTKEGALQAEQILGKIPASSPNAGARYLLTASMLSRRNDFPAADKAYTSYFGKISTPGASAREQKEFEEAVNQYAAVVTKLGDPDRVVDILKKLELIPSADEDNLRRIQTQQLFGMLAAMDQAILLKKKPNTAAIQKAKKMAEDIIWKGTDQYAALAYVEIGHACLLLGDFDGVLNKINESAAIMKPIEEQMAADKVNISLYSPKSGAFYYMAMATAAKARALNATKPQEAQELAEEAVKIFNFIKKKYRQSAFAVRAAMAKSKLCADFKMETGAVAGAGDSGEMLSLIQEATPFLQIREYTTARKYLLGAVRAGRSCEEHPQAITMLLECLGGTGESLAGEALAAYLAEAYPQDQDTGDTLTRYYFKLTEEAKGLPEGDKKEAKTDAAMRVQMLYIGIAPKTDQKAPAMGYDLAEKMYKRGVVVASSAKLLPKGKEKDEILLKAQQRFLEAAPFYQWVIDRFPGSAKATASSNKLAWIYYSSADATHPERYKAAAVAFDKYAETETDLELQCGPRLQAIFRAAESYMLAGEVETALQRFPQVPKELEAEIPQKFIAGLMASEDPKKKKQGQAFLDFRDLSLAYMAWSYDMWAANLRTEMVQMDKKKAELDVLEENAAGRIKIGDRMLEEVKTKIQQAQADFEEFKAPLYAAPGVADAERKKKEWEKTGTMSAGQIKDKCAEIVENSSKNWKKQLGVESGELLTTKKRIQGEVVKTGSERERAETALLKLQEELASLADTLKRRNAEMESVQTKMKASASAYEKAAAECGKAEALLNQAKKITKVEPKNPSPNWLAWKKVRGEYAQKVQDLQKEMEAAAKKRDDAMTDAVKAQMKSLQEAIANAATRQKEISPTLPDRQDELVLAKKLEELAVVKLAAIEVAIKRNEMAVKLAESKSATQVVEDPAYKKALDAELGGREKMLAVQLAFEETRRVIATRSRDAAAAEHAKIREQSTATENERAPRLVLIEEKKKKAMENLNLYLKTFPAGKLAPDAMSRLGSLLLEFKQFDEAAKIFDSLAQKFPTTNAAKMAKFNVGRAYAETNQPDKAAAAFAEALKQMDDQSLFNIKYIAEALLEKAPKVAFAAASEIITRGENEKSVDYVRAKNKWLREPMLILAAKAAIGKGDPLVALELTKKLEAENERSAFFFDVKFVQAAAYRAKNPPDNDGALGALGEILSAQPVVEIRIRALLEAASACVDAGGKERQKEALSAYQEVMLDDPGQGDSVRAGWEKAAVEGVKLCVTLGEKKKCDKIVSTYKEKMPNGKALPELERALSGIAGTP